MEVADKGYEEKSKISLALRSNPIKQDIFTSDRYSARLSVRRKKMFRDYGTLGLQQESLAISSCTWNWEQVYL